MRYALFAPLAAALGLLAAGPALAGPPEHVPGVRARYYSDTDFETVIADRIDREIRIEEREEPLPLHDRDDDTYAVRWTGLLDVPRTGEYTFRARVDDAFRMWIDGEVVMPRWVYRQGQTDETLRLEEGLHPIRIDFRNTGGGALLDLQWQGPKLRDGRLGSYLRTGPWQGMPLAAAEAFADPTDRVPGLRAAYYKGEDFGELAAVQLDPGIRVTGTFPFDDGRREDLAIRWTGALKVDRKGRYRFRATSDDGLRLWIGNELVLDVWEARNETTADVHLDAGWHALRCDYNQGRGDLSLDLTWEGPGVQRGPLAAEALATTPWHGMAAAQPMVCLLMLGHSNLGGHAERPFDPGPRAYLYDVDRRLWRHVEDGDRGAAAALLAALTKAYPDLRFGAVKVVETGSRVEQTWRRGKQGYRKAVQAVDALPRGATLAGVVTLLGWPDAGESKRDVAEGFEANYRKMVEELRRQIDRPRLPWIASRVEFGRSAMRKDGTPEDEWQLVYDAFPKLAETMDGLRVVESEGCDLIDNHHYSHKGYVTWAKRTLDVFKDLGLVKRVAARTKERLAARGVPARVLAAPSPGAGDPERTVAEVEAVVRRHSTARSLEQLGTYDHCLVVTEYEVRKVHKGELPERRFLTVQFSIRDRTLQPAHDFRPGDVHRLRLGEWAAQTRWHGEAMDDTIMDLRRPLHWVHNLRVLREGVSGTGYLIPSGSRGGVRWLRGIEYPVPETPG